MASDSLKRFRFEWERRICAPGGPRRPPTRHVCLTLATHWNQRSTEICVSFETLAIETGMNEKAVRTHIRHAIDEGWLMRWMRGNGRGWKVSVYGLSFPADGAGCSSGPHATMVRADVPHQHGDGPGPATGPSADGAGPTPGPSDGIPSDALGPGFRSDGPGFQSVGPGRQSSMVRADDPTNMVLNTELTRTSNTGAVGAAPAEGEERHGKPDAAELARGLARKFARGVQ
ncbi:MAG TPA: helix-turn-helix domain-containing protein [Burkholderiales bacterium]|nr:helix-turn-helix domain-containing protein [Burkholderiales bacterium]